MLADGWGDKLVIVPSGKGLDVYPLKSWEELEARVAALPSLDPDARQFQLPYLSLGQDVILDPQGRVQISSDLSRARGPDEGRADHRHAGEVRGVERGALGALRARHGSAAPIDDSAARLAGKGV